MAVFRPFKGIRPQESLVEQVVSLPYDVMNKEEAKAMAKDNTYNFLNVTRSEITIENLDNDYDVKVYQRAKSNLEDMIKSKVLIPDQKSCYYIYRQIMNGRTQTGLVGCTSIDDYQKDFIKKHEFTRVEKELDRINHFDFCNANTEPVFITYRTNDEIKFIIDEWINDNNPIYNFITNDDISHIVWIVDKEETIKELEILFSSMNSLYIADGHHRSASAVKVGLKRRESNPNYSGEEEFNYFLSVLFADDELLIMDYNRVVKDLNGFSSEEFINLVAKSFAIEKTSMLYKPEKKYTFGMYLDNQWYKLIAKEEIINKENVIDSLDVSILQDYLLSPILGIKDPRVDKRIDFVGGIRGIAELERRVNSDMKVAFSLFPTSMNELMSVADMGKVMPPKSTWFEPKLRSGLFIHML